MSGLPLKSITIVDNQRTGAKNLIVITFQIWLYEFVCPGWCIGRTFPKNHNTPSLFAKLYRGCRERVQSVTDPSQPKPTRKCGLLNQLTITIPTI